MLKLVLVWLIAIVLFLAIMVVLHGANPIYTIQLTDMNGMPVTLRLGNGFLPQVSAGVLRTSYNGGLMGMPSSLWGSNRSGNGQSVKLGPGLNLIYDSTGQPTLTGPVFVDAVTPLGVMDGVNAVFTLPSTPNPPASLLLVWNGRVQNAGTDFVLSGTIVTFQPAIGLADPTVGIPHPGDLLVAYYRK